MKRKVRSFGMCPDEFWHREEEDDREDGAGWLAGDTALKWKQRRRSESYLQVFHKAAGEFFRTLVFSSVTLQLSTKYCFWNMYIFNFYCGQQGACADICVDTRGFKELPWLYYANENITLDAWVV